MFPAYEDALTQIGDWICTGAKLIRDVSFANEPALPQGPDGCAICFELNGDWDEEKRTLTIALMVVTRGATLKDARFLARTVVKAALDGFKAGQRPLQGGLKTLRCDKLFALRPRDERNRVIVESRLTARLDAPSEFGAAQ